MNGRALPHRTTVTVTAAVVVALAALTAACGSEGGAGPAATPSSAAPSPSWSGPALSADEARAVRDQALAYWAAYNAYDADGAIAFLAPEYRSAKAEVIRDEVGRIKTFGVQLGVKPKSPPEAIGAGAAQLYLSMKTPTGMRTVLMKFADRDGVWLVTYSEEVD